MGEVEFWGLRIPSQIRSPQALFGGLEASASRKRYQPRPIRKFWIEVRSPNAFKSHTTITITTTAFKIDSIDAAIGMSLFTSQSRKPTAIRVRRSGSKGMIY